MEAERFINAGYYGSSGHTSSFASPSPQGTQTCSHSHVGTNAQRRVLTPAGGAQGSSDLKPTPEPVEKLTDPQLPFFSPQFFMNELRPKGVYFFMNGSPRSE